MATIGDILPRKFPGALFAIEEDDYSTLVWFPENTIPKPAEADIRAFSAEVDGMVQADRDAEVQERALRDRPDAILTALEILASGDAARIAALRAKIVQIRKKRAT